MESSPANYDEVCDHFEVNLGFKLVKDVAYRHHAGQRLYNASHFRCFIKQVKDGYIHIAVALSRVTDNSGLGRVGIACTLAEDDMIYGVRGFYAHVMPYDAVPTTMVWLKDATRDFTQVSTNVNFIAGRYHNSRQRTKASARAWFKAFLFRLKKIATMS